MRPIQGGDAVHVRPLVGGPTDRATLFLALDEHLSEMSTADTIAVAVYDVLRRYSPRAALGFVTSRVIEASVIFAGVFAIASALAWNAASLIAFRTLSATAGRA